MKCIYCGHKTVVINSRLQLKPNQVWRRRQCLACQQIFSSLEGVDWSQAIRVSFEKPKLAHLDAPLGADEQQTEPYMKYGEGAAQAVTTRSAKSNDRATGSARRQIDAVRKFGGNLQPFSRDTLFISIYEACRHRKSAVSDATSLIRTILGKLIPLVQDATLQRDQIVQITAEVLRRFDKAAATAYQAYHSS